jgi:hypothetical protein
MRNGLEGAAVRSSIALFNLFVMESTTKENPTIS